MSIKNKPIFEDLNDLTENLYRMHGLIDGIYLADDSPASPQIIASVLKGIHATLQRDIAALIDAAETGELVIKSDAVA